MKRIIALLLLALISVPCLAAGGGRFNDRNWTVTQVTLNATAVRVTIPKSGALWIQPQGSDMWIAFNATANADSIKVAQDADRDFWPANITYGEYFTLYSTSTVTANYIIMD